MLSGSILDKLHLVVVIPPVFLGVVATALVALGLGGANPFWAETKVTLSEAAALRDQATVVAMLKEGRDPNATYDVRAGLIAEREMRMTPMEAAIHEDRTEVMSLLLKGNVRATNERLCAWLALAAAHESEEAAAYLRDGFRVESQACESDGPGTNQVSGR